MDAPRDDRVVITGASGLLGAALIETLADSFPLILLSHSSSREGMTAVDLASEGGIRAVAAMDWQAMVHCAAFRSPDYCEQHRQAALELNAKAPARLAATAAERGARFIHISTDYVFDGRHPPYGEEDNPNPVNYYGETKQQAEQAVAAANPSAVILRIPALYGVPPPPLRSPLLDEAVEVALCEKPTTRDNSLVRVPTYTGDVAAVVGFLLRNDCAGIVHAGAPRESTQYEWTRAVAALLGKDPSHILPRESDPTRKATRPHNAHLATDRLAALGGPVPAPFDKRLPEALRRKGYPIDDFRLMISDLRSR